MQDTDKIQKLLLFVRSITDQIRLALIDGKIDLYEGLGIIPSLIAIVDIVKSKAEIKDEFLDLDATEVVDLAAYISDEIDGDEALKELVFEWTFAALTLSRTIRITVDFAKTKRGNAAPIDEDISE